MILAQAVRMEDKKDKRKFFGSLVIPACIVTMMWVVKIIEVSFGIGLGRYGLVPQTLNGLYGILTLPFLHGNWEHLMTNSVSLLVLGTALYYFYPTLANPVMLITYLLCGLLTWCLGSPNSVHIGASALIYGLNLFLITSGFIRGNRMLVVISLVMVFLYGGFVWGMIPELAELQSISWEGHLSGAMAGIVLALALRKKGPQKETHHWDEDDDESSDESEGTNHCHPEDKPYWDVPTPSNEELTVQYRIRH